MRNTSRGCEADQKESTGELVVVLCQLSCVLESWLVWSVGVLEWCWSGGGGGVHGCLAGPPPPPTLVPGVASLAEAGLVAALSHHHSQCSQ